MNRYTRWQDFGRSPASGGSERHDAVESLRRRVHELVIDALGPTVAEGALDEGDVRPTVHEQMQRALAEGDTALSASEKAALVQAVTDDLIGYGPLEAALADEDVTEIMVNGPKQVYEERAGRIVRSPVEFLDEDHVLRIIDRIVSGVGRRVDESTPMVDARLPDGSRVNAVVHPLAIGGPYLTIRKFATDPYTVADLVGFGTLSEPVASFLDACVRGRLNVVVSGGTGTGKTTLLNVLSGFIPGDERIVTVEDAKELRLHQEHVCSLEARPANIEGRGEVTIRDLVRNALRMRPDRIVVGEARGAEAIDMLQAMNTGHDGSITTVHSNTPRDTLARIETMTLMAGIELPVRAIREQMASAIDLIVHLQRLRDGTRRVTHVTEVLGMEGDTIVLQDLYLFDFGMGLDRDRRFAGHLKSTGIRPGFGERLADHGIELPSDLFTQEAFARRVVGLR